MIKAKIGLNEMKWKIVHPQQINLASLRYFNIFNSLRNKLDSLKNAIDRNIDISEKN